MNPNTKRIREVADAILRYGDLYDQGTYGETFSEIENDDYMKDAYEQAGVGMHNCDTPACVAGFTVQIFGEPNEYRKMAPDFADTSIYAQHLLGLNDNWACHIFHSWPRHWNNEDAEELKPFTWLVEGIISAPDARQAHKILYRLADQFDNKTIQENE